MTETFENLLVNIDELPELTAEEFNPIDSSYLRVIRIGYGIFFLVMLVVPLVIIYVNDEYREDYYLYGIFGGATLLIWIINFIIITKAYNKKKYALRERDIIYLNGLFWSKRIAIPFNRIQHAEVKQGPIERFYGLHNLKIFTAGGSSSDLSIPGLKEETALKLKNFILEKVEEDGIHS